MRIYDVVGSTSGGRRGGREWDREWETMNDRGWVRVRRWMLGLGLGYSFTRKNVPKKKQF